MFIVDPQQILDTLNYLIKDRRYNNPVCDRILFGLFPYCKVVGLTNVKIYISGLLT